ncbi:hypothetical protein J2Y40_001668 [Chryseobacterium sp. 2987]|nr:hypothetical protein [Chryseobacterium sp. 2987]
MERELLIININGTAFLVYVDSFQLKQKTTP